MWFFCINRPLTHPKRQFGRLLLKNIENPKLLDLPKRLASKALFNDYGLSSASILHFEAVMKRLVVPVLILIVAFFAFPQSGAKLGWLFRGWNDFSLRNP